MLTDSKTILYRRFELAACELATAHPNQNIHADTILKHKTHDEFVRAGLKKLKAARESATKS